MSNTQNWHCDMCEAKWMQQTFIPKDLLGFNDKRQLEQGGKTYKHICKTCAVAVAESVRELATAEYDFGKLNGYYTQERFDADHGK